MEAGQLVAHEQFALTEYAFPTVEGLLAGQKEDAPIDVIQDNSCLIVTAGGTTVTWNRRTGLIDYLDVDGRPMLEEGYSLTPNFWRAPTDNDFGAGLQQRFVAWKELPLYRPQIKNERQGGTQVVSVDYDLRAYKAILHMVYTLTADGQLIVSQSLETGIEPEAEEQPEGERRARRGPDTTPIPDIEKTHLFRFGMQLVMPKAFDAVEYYGKGPGENYPDRNNDQMIGHFTQTVREQFYPYVRPQENGNHTEVRWWKVLDKEGRGLEFYGTEPLNATSLHFLQSDLDDGMAKAQRHSGDLTERPFTVVSIDKTQFGLGCVNSWGAWPLAQYQLPYADYDYTFVIRPVK
jgi:beta-galactosidase